MASLPQPYRLKRSPRLRLNDATPAVLRFHDGRRKQAEIKTISMTGGLLGLSVPLNQGSQVRLMFLTRAGAVLGSAEMLKPVTWGLQPFRFLSLDESSMRRLKCTIQPHAPAEQDSDEWIRKYRAALQDSDRPRKRVLRTIVAALTVAAACACAAIFAHGIHLQ